MVAELAPPKPRWGEMEDEEAEDLDFLLPPKQITGPDENGIKKIIVYKFNDEGHKVKTTTISRVRKLAEARLSKRAVERREWARFGSPAIEDASGITLVSTEEVVLERPRPPGSKQDETKASGDSLQAKGAVLMVCRICLQKGDHWTVQCPNKHMAQSNASFTNKPPTPDADKAGPGGNTYVPPSRRDTVDRRDTEMRRRNDENSVRVTNLSEDTREADLAELFRPFGHVIRTYVAMDKSTDMSRGFGFVNFSNREDAERAINKLNGYGYDNLILRVEWAAPRAN